jgi:hypothetical protein
MYNLDSAMGSTVYGVVYRKKGNNGRSLLKGKSSNA